VTGGSVSLKKKKGGGGAETASGSKGEGLGRRGGEPEKNRRDLKKEGITDVKGHGVGLKGPLAKNWSRGDFNWEKETPSRKTISCGKAGQGFGVSIVKERASCCGTTELSS